MNAENTTNSLSFVPLACENKPESITFSDNNNDNKEKKTKLYSEYKTIKFRLQANSVNQKQNNLTYTSAAKCF